MRGTQFGLNVSFAASLVFGLAIATLPEAANAGIESVHLRKGQTFAQTSNSQPDDPLLNVGQLLVVPDYWKDHRGATTTTSSPLSPITLVPESALPAPWEFRLGLGGGGYYYQRIEPTLEALDESFPNGAVYTSTVHTASSGSYSASATSLDANYFPPVPYFAGDAYNRLQGVDASADIQLDWQGFSVPEHPLGLPTNGYILINFRRTSDNAFVGFEIGDSELFTSWTIPRDWLDADTDYYLTLHFEGRVTGDAFPDFDGAVEAEQAFARETTMHFSTAAVPEPSSLILLGLGGVAIAAFSRRRLRR